MPSKDWNLFVWTLVTFSCFGCSLGSSTDEQSNLESSFGGGWWPSLGLVVLFLCGLLYGLDGMSRRTLRSTMGFAKKLEEFGYDFKNRKLVNVKTGAPFEFVVKKDDKMYNQKHYEALGEVITEYVFELLEKEAKLLKVEIPFDKSKAEPTGFFYGSKDALTNEKLLILIHGSGVVRAGQWSRKLIINEGLDRGTQLPYIEKGKQRGFGIVVLNTNYNKSRNADGVTEYIRGSENGVAHTLYVWKEFIRKAKATKIAIVAHSAGGYDTMKLAEEEIDDFKKRVFAVCLTDSAHFLSKKEGSEFLKKVGRNWVTSDKPLDTELTIGGRDIDRVSAGARNHEDTSPAAIEAVFKYIDKSLGTGRVSKTNGNPSSTKKRPNGNSEEEENPSNPVKSKKIMEKQKEEI